MMLALILCLTTVHGHAVCWLDPTNMILQENVPGYHAGTVVQTDAGIVIVKEPLRKVIEKLRDANDNPAWPPL